MLNLAEIEGELLLDLAHAAIAEALGLPHGPLAREPAWLREPGASFVTLEFGDDLHGCIGTIEPHRPLGEDVRRNALLAAFEDPRSRALRRDELARVDLSVAVLGPLAPLPFTDERDARAKLRPGVDGLLLRWRGHRGVFLPKVWDKLPTPREFLDQLKRKAGLPSDFWAPDLALERYEVRSFTRRHDATGTR
ncbi:AmmeMemoRadiSam system protein A [Nannocystaceae bacterium ST9]